MKSSTTDKPASNEEQTLFAGSSLPRPAPDKHGARKITILAIFAVLALACAIYWLGRTPTEKAALRKDLAQAINSTLADTPMAGAGKIFSPEAEKKAPPVPPTDAGTLAGQEVTGTIAAPVELGTQGGIAAYALPAPSNSETPAHPETSTLQKMAEIIGFSTAPSDTQITFSQDVLPPATEDATLKSRYFTRLAEWLVNRSNSSGSLSATPQSLNQECGSTLVSDIAGGRKALLRYAFHPTMLSALYNLYIDRFMGDLDEAAHKKGLNAQQNRQFHLSLAGSAALLARAVAGIEQIGDLESRMHNINQLAQQTVDANARLSSMIFELDRLRESTAPDNTYSLVQNQVQNAAAAYNNANHLHTEAQASLAALIRQHAGPGLGDETLLFIAAWIERRRAAGGDSRAAVHTSAELLKDFAARCARVAEEQ